MGHTYGWGAEEWQIFQLNFPSFQGSGWREAREDGFVRPQHCQIESRQGRKRQHGLANIHSVFLSLLRQDLCLWACTPSLVCPAMHTGTHGPTFAHALVARVLHLLQKQKSRNVDFTVIKNYFKNITSPFTVPHLAKEGLRNEQMPSIPNTTPQHLWLSPKVRTISETKHCQNCVLWAWTLGDGKQPAMLGRPKPLSSEKHVRNSRPWVC